MPFSQPGSPPRIFSFILALPAGSNLPAWLCITSPAKKTQQHKATALNLVPGRAAVARTPCHAQPWHHGSRLVCAWQGIGEHWASPSPGQETLAARGDPHFLMAPKAHGYSHLLPMEELNRIGGRGSDVQHGTSVGKRTVRQMSTAEPPEGLY